VGHVVSSLNTQHGLLSTPHCISPVPLDIIVTISTNQWCLIFYCLPVMAVATGPAACVNPPNSVLGFTWASCPSSTTAAVGFTCTGGWVTPGYTASSGGITATCNDKGLYDVKGQQCVGDSKRQCSFTAAWLAPGHHHSVSKDRHECTCASLTAC
jgi:hypothetical protein